MNIDKQMIASSKRKKYPDLEAIRKVKEQSFFKATDVNIILFGSILLYR